ncbi:MAG TPA: Tn3 family transposase [Hyphomicrobiaceae bacterium]|nr:Tn3 family transposase [Hyphomicrobiaceae bacterium]
MEIWQGTFLGRRTLPPDLSDYQIQAFFTFSPDDLSALKVSFRPSTRIAAAIQLGFLSLSGTKLDSINVLPRNLLKHVSDQLELPAPTIASLKRLYKGERTKMKQLAWAMDRLGWQKPTFDADRQLADYLDQVVSSTISRHELLEKARRWSYDRKYLLRAESAYERVCGNKFAASEQALFKEIDRVIPKVKRDEWLRTLLAPRGSEGRTTVLEWLKKPPSGRGPRSRANVSEKVAFLKELGVTRTIIQSIPVERVKGYARAFSSRKPSRIERLTDPLRALELVSFLWHTLMRNSDLVIQMSRKAFASLKSTLRTEVGERMAASALELMQGIEEIKGVMEAEDLDLDSTRQRTLEIISRFIGTVNSNKSEATRELLTKQHHQVESLMRPLVDLDLESDQRGVAIQSVEVVRDLFDAKNKRLPPGVKAPCSGPWNKLVNQNEDSEAAYYAFVAAALEETHRALRRGELYVSHSEEHRGRDELLISSEAWPKQRLRFYSELNHPTRAEEFLAPYLQQLPIKLKEMAEACAASDFEIDRTRMSISPIKAELRPAGYTDYKHALAAEMGPIQLPELILKIDAETRFSWQLLGRPPKDKVELITVYAALLVNGTNLSAKAVSMMTPGLTAEQIIAMMLLIEQSKNIRAANAAVLEFMLRHKIVKQWCAEDWASSDMMSLEASHRLQNARRDPRLKTPAIGTYTHVSGRWGILYDRPIVLGTRQAGHAIEGHLRQYSEKLLYLAVDTHGYTNFAIGLAKLLRLDLFPRIRDLDERKLLVPYGTEVPEILRPVTKFISLKAFIKNYDQLMRVAGSVKDGTLTAILACQKFGSDAAGDAVRDAGEQLGKLLRTLFLCDYYTKPDFRRELHRVLNRGEAVHVLQRAIYSGRMPHQKGRTNEALEAISGSLTLLTNLVMAWTTQQIQAASERLAERGVVAPSGVLMHIGPARLWNVNLRGTLHWPIDTYADRILAGTGRGRAWLGEVRL